MSLNVCKDEMSRDKNYVKEQQCHGTSMSRNIDVQGQGKCPGTIILRDKDNGQGHKTMSMDMYMYTH